MTLADPNKCRVDEIIDSVVDLVNDTWCRPRQGGKTITAAVFPGPAARVWCGRTGAGSGSCLLPMLYPRFMKPDRSS